MQKTQSPCPILEVYPTPVMLRYELQLACERKLFLWRFEFEIAPCGNNR